MKERMGNNHSTFNCDEISASIHNCFGLSSSRNQYETDSKSVKKQTQSSSVCKGTAVNHNETLEIPQPKRKPSRKSRCSKDASCCKSTAVDQDNIPYNVCDHSSDSQIDEENHVSSSPLMRSRDRKSSGETSSIYKLTDNFAQQFHSPSLPIEGDSQSKKVLIVEADFKDQSLKTSVHKNSVENSCDNNDEFNRGDDFTTFNLDYSVKNIVKESSTLNNSTNNMPIVRKEATNNQRKGEEIKPALETKQEEEKIIGVQHFRNLIASETVRLNESTDKWEKFLVGGNSHCPNEICDEIRTVIGQTRLVISERFTQFSKLVDRADGVNSSSNDCRPVLISDLQGFWDMIYFQVQDVDAKFQSLDHLQANQWKSSDSSSLNKSSSKSAHKPKTTVRKGPAKKKIQISEEDKKRREAARKRIAEARKAAAHRNKIEQDTRKTESVAEPNPPRPAFTEEPTTKIDEGGEVKADENSKTSRKRPESIVDAITCAVAVSHVNNDTTSLSSISSTGLVHG